MTLNNVLRDKIEGRLDPFLDVLDRIGFTPNHISFLGLVTAALVGIPIYFNSESSLFLLLSVFLLLGSGILDFLDGELARYKNMRSKKGDFTDHLIDRYADILIIIGISVSFELPLLGLLSVTGVLMTSYVGTQAQAVGINRIYGGLLGRADRIIIIGVALTLQSIYAAEIILFDLVEWLLVILCVLGHFTALQRTYSVYQKIENSNPDE